MSKAPAPTFEVRFVATGLVPEELPLRLVSDALGAIQDLASGRDPFETNQVPESKMIGLVKVRRGSAVYSCVARDPDEALGNLRYVGQFLEHTDNGGDGIDSRLIAALRPIESLSNVARSLDCRVEVRMAGNRVPLLAIKKGIYEQLASRVFLTGDTTVIGTVERVGGATEMRCSLRVPQRRRLLYCDVKSKALVQRLGQHLYEQIAAVGTATWIHSSWRIHKFTIRDFTQPRLGRVNEAIDDFREAGLSAWDEIEFYSYDKKCRTLAGLVMRALDLPDDDPTDMFLKGDIERGEVDI